MKRDTEKLLALLKNAALTREEFSAVRARLSETMKAGPATFSSSARVPLWMEMRAAALRRFSFARNMFIAPIALALILSLTAGGSVALAAEGAVPGDTLYPMKIHVNERVAAALAVSPEAKADLDARLAEERLNEAAVLAVDNRLTDGTKDEVRDRVAERLEKTKGRLEELRKSGRDRAARDVEKRLRASLERRADILRDLEVSASFSDDTADDTRTAPVLRAATTSSSGELEHPFGDDHPSSHEDVAPTGSEDSQPPTSNTDDHGGLRIRIPDDGSSEGEDGGDSHSEESGRRHGRVRIDF